MLVGCDAGEERGDRLRRRARIPQRIGIAVEVLFVDDLPVARDENARDLLELAARDRGLHRLQLRGVDCGGEEERGKKAHASLDATAGERLVPSSQFVCGLRLRMR